MTWRVRSPLCEQKFQHVLSLQRKRHVLVVWLALVQNLRTKTRRHWSLTWFLGLMEHGGVRTRHDQYTLTATYASNRRASVTPEASPERSIGEEVEARQRGRSPTMLGCGRLELKKRHREKSDGRGGRDGRGTRPPKSDQETGAEEHI